MPHASAADGTKLYYEEIGVGRPVVFVHEYAGDYRSWETQVRHLSRQYRCITFSQRGYPPSDVPKDGERYSQDIVRDDVKALLDHLDLERAHIVGHSMGAYTTLHVGIRYPERCLSLTVAGCGWGSDPATREHSIALARGIGEMFRKEGIVAAAAKYADFGMRQQYKAKDPRGWAEFARWMSEHSAEGHALTMLQIQLRRPTLWDLEEKLKQMRVPTLVITGDEDEACIDGSVMLKRTVPGAALMVIPRAGHTINSEEPAKFNDALLEFFGAVENRRWMAHRKMALDDQTGGSR
jgi:pimeloyl-ACP methyl ester carboxylesterase